MSDSPTSFLLPVRSSDMPRGEASCFAHIAPSSSSAPLIRRPLQRGAGEQVSEERAGASPAAGVFFLRLWHRTTPPQLRRQPMPASLSSTASELAQAAT